jgi:putative addiction module killer protein
MSKKAKELKIYQLPNGKEPFIDWLESIKDRKTRNRIITRLDRLEIGNSGDSRHLDEGVFELRLHLVPVTVFIMVKMVL